MGLGALQPGHLIVLLVIVLLIFGPGKLPQLGRAVGDSLNELKKATGNGDSEASTTASTAAWRKTIRPVPPASSPRNSSPRPTESRHSR